MTQDAVVELPDRFSIGRTIATSFAVFGRNLGAFLLIAFTISLPYIVLQTWADYRDLQSPSGGGGYQGGIGFLQTVIFTLVQAALTYGVLQDLRGSHPTLGACFQNGLAASSRLIRGAFLFSILFVLGLIALVVPGIVLYLMWWVFVPVIVVEGSSITGSFGRSRELTAGHRWGILGLLVLMILVFAVGAVVVAALLYLVAGDLAGEVGVTLVAVLFSAFSSVTTAVGYYYLRAEKEGIVIDDIARVFD